MATTTRTRLGEILFGTGLIADRIRPALAPSLAHSARDAVRRLQTTPEAARDLLCDPGGGPRLLEV